MPTSRPGTGIAALAAAQVRKANSSRIANTAISHSQVFLPSLARQNDSTVIAASTTVIAIGVARVGTSTTDGITAIASRKPTSSTSPIHRRCLVRASHQQAAATARSTTTSTTTITGAGSATSGSWMRSASVLRRNE